MSTAAGRLNVGDAKTDAGRRYVDLLAPLRSDLAVHNAATRGRGRGSRLPDR